MSRTKAVFFDRDGTLNVDVHYLHRAEDFVWIEGAREAIRFVKDQGYLAILITNQSGVARGYYPEEDVLSVYDWMNEELKKVGTSLDGIYYCPHHKDGILPQYAVSCNCRKPKTGMVDKACEEYEIDRTQSFFVGDSDADMKCAENAGLKGIRYTGGSLLEALKKEMEK